MRLSNQAGRRCPVSTPTGCLAPPALPRHMGPVRLGGSVCVCVGAGEGRVSDRVHEGTHASVSDQCGPRSKCSSACPPPRTRHARPHACAGPGVVRWEGRVVCVNKAWWVPALWCAALAQARACNDCSRGWRGLPRTSQGSGGRVCRVRQARWPMQRSAHTTKGARRGHMV